MMTTRRITTYLFSALLLMALVTGCDSMSGNDGTARGSLKVLMTDAPFPFDLVEEANVTISRVEIEGESSGLIELTNDDHDFNLLTLRDGNTTELVLVNSLPEDHFDKLILSVSDASVVLKDGQVFDLKVPSGKIRVLLGDGFTFDGTNDLTLTLDFDVSKSFVVLGNPFTPAGIKGFLFKPVVKSLGFDHDDEEEEDHFPRIEAGLDDIGDDFIVMAGAVLSIDSGTEFDGFDSLLDLLVDNRLEVAFTEEEDGSLRALSVKLTGDASDDTGEVSGLVTDGADNFIEISGVTLLVDENTEFDEEADPASLAVDTRVEATFVQQDDGTLLATKIEVDD